MLNTSPKLVKNYCESTIVRGVPIFRVFMGRPNHDIWFPTKKENPIFVYTENPKTHIQEFKSPILFNREAVTKGSSFPQSMTAFLTERILTAYEVCNLPWESITKYLTFPDQNFTCPG